MIKLMLFNYVCGLAGYGEQGLPMASSTTRLLSYPPVSCVSLHPARSYESIFLIVIIQQSQWYDTVISGTKAGHDVLSVTEC